MASLPLRQKEEYRAERAALPMFHQRTIGLTVVPLTEPRLARLYDGLRAAVDPELAENNRHIVADRPLAYVEPRSDCAIVEALRDQRATSLAELHAEVAAEQLLQPGDGRRIHLADRGDVGFELIAGAEAVALEHDLGHLEVFGVLDHRLDAPLDGHARRGRRVAVDHENLAPVANRARHGFVGFPFRPRWINPMNLAIGFADGQHIRRSRVAHKPVAVHKTLCEQRHRMAVLYRRPHALLEDRRRLRIEVDFITQQRESDVALARIACDESEGDLEHREPEHRIDGRDYFGHAKDERLARVEDILGRLNSGRRRGIGNPPHRGCDQRQKVGDFRTRAVEAEEQPYEQLAGTDEHSGAVAQDSVCIIVHGNDAAGTRHVLHNDAWLTLDVARKPIGDNAAVEIGPAAWRKADQHLDMLALIERRLLGEDRQADEQDLHPAIGAQRQIFLARKSRVLADRLPIDRSLALQDEADLNAPTRRLKPVGSRIKFCDHKLQVAFGEGTEPLFRKARMLF